jgi:hypothetical protein
MSDASSIDLLYSPIALPEGFDQRLTGRVFASQWARGFSALLNLYAFIFLFGGAVCSAIQYSEIEKGRTRFLGNILIAIGTLLPGIGGTFTGSATWRSCISWSSLDSRSSTLVTT